jgi:AcrR family transcriptional regulator
MSDTTTQPSGRRESILQAAIAVFSEHGYRGATMDEISRRAGVAKGTPYLYFPAKADLFYAVFERWTGEVTAVSTQAAARAGNAKEALAGMTLSAAEYIDSHREWFSLSLEAWAAASTPDLREQFAGVLQALYAQYRRTTAALIRQGQESGEWRADLDSDALAALLTGAIDGLFVQCWFDPAMNAQKTLRGFFEVLERGMSARMTGEE